MINHPYEFEALTGGTFEDWDLKHDDWKSCITIEPLESHESFQIMEQFANKMDDINFREQLINILNRKRPFANFKAIIENSHHRQNWFDFKTRRLENHVKELLLNELG